MTDGDNLLKWTAEAATVGLKPGEWPETFEYDGKTWTKEHQVAAENGDVQFTEYVTKADEGRTWMVVYA